MADSVMRPAYLDYHATTPVDPRVLDAMLPYFTEQFGNPASRQHAFGWKAQEAVDAGRFHHQWLPDRIVYERHALSPDTVALLRAKGHALAESNSQGVAEVVIYNAKDDLLEGGVDRRQSDGGVAVQ